MQLTEHFSLAELCASDTALRLGIDNAPPAELIDDLRETAELGELIRAALNEGQSREVFVVVTSGYRCEALERVLCAKDFARWCERRQVVADEAAWKLYFKNKSHPKGRSLDIKAPRFGTPRQIAEFLVTRHGIMEKLDQLIEEGDWLHCAWSDSPRGEVKTARFDANGHPTYTKGLT
jgi:hypothetical protein